jgi:hypothetical protein
MTSRQGMNVNGSLRIFHKENGRIHAVIDAIYLDGIKYVIWVFNQGLKTTFKYIINNGVLTPKNEFETMIEIEGYKQLCNLDIDTSNGTICYQGQWYCESNAIEGDRI